MVFRDPISVEREREREKILQAVERPWGRHNNTKRDRAELRRAQHLRRGAPLIPSVIGGVSAAGEGGK